MKLAVDFDTSPGLSGRRQFPQHTAKKNILRESIRQFTQAAKAELKKRHASWTLDSSFKCSTGFVIQNFGAHAKNIEEKQAKISLLI